MEKEKRLSFASSHPDPLQYSAKTISSSKPIHSTLQKNSKELSPIALNHLKLLLHQQLRLTDLPPDRISIWLNVLSKILISVGLNVEPDIKNGDEMGLLQYVKIKNVCGGRPEDSHYVAGVVCTKIVPHKSMLRVVENPRILLVMFPIEFTGEEEFESLDMLLISEREFIRNLVYRILDFKPNVILCSKSVSRLALNLFIQSNVVVIPNVKPTVIEAVARCTQADIFSDVTFNNQPKLGLCQKFYTKTYSHSIPPHFKSTYLYFSGCPKQLGCTVVLRGENIQTLAKLKQITDLMAFVVYNLKLETFLYRDICAPEFQVLEEKMIKDWGIGSGAEITKDDVNVFNALLKFKKTILTASPGIKFPPPYQLLQYAEKHELVKKYNLPADFFEGSYNLTTPPNLNFPTNGQVNGNQYHNRSLEPQNEILIDAKYLDILSVDGLSPYQQQYLMLLYSNLCTHNTTPCRPPEPLIIEYYRDTDMTLGQYLEELASKSTTNCPSKDCDRPMLSHFWVYAHNNGRINVIIEDYPCPIPNATSKILVWSFCKQCRTTTEIIQMSNETWHYSFGKYLELSFYLDANVVIPKKEDDVIPESPTTTPTTPKVNGQHNFSKYCTHNVFRDHIRYFGTQNLVVRFEFEPIDLFDISHPSIQLYNHAPTNLKLRNADLAVLQSQIEAYYGSLRNRLDTINYSSIAEYKHLEVEDYLQDLDFRVESEMEEFRELKKSVEMENVNDTLVTKRVLVWFKEKISEWDLEFATFQKKVWGDGKGGKWGKDVLRAFTESGDGKKKEKKKEREAAKKKEEKAEMEWGWEEEKEFEEPKLGSSPTIQLASLPVPEDEEDFLENKIGINIMSNSSPVLDTPTYPMIQSIPLSDSFSGAMTLPSTVSISTSQFSNNNRMSVNLVGQGSVGLESELSATSAPTVAKLWELIEYDCVAEPEVFVDIIDLGLGYEEYELSQGETFFEPVEEENNVVEEEEENLGNATAVTNANGAISSQGSVAEVKKDKNEDEGNKAGGLMKTIAGLWTGGAGGLAPLEYPPAMNEHIFPDSQIVVRENEPSSIIAFTLASKDYNEKLQTMFSTTTASSPPTPGIPIEDELEAAGGAGSGAGGGYVDFEGGYTEQQNAMFDEEEGHQNGQDVTIMIDADQGFTSEKEKVEVKVDIEELLLRGTGTHIIYQFSDGPTKLYCKIFFAEQFDALRRFCGADASYIHHLARCAKWDVSGGKSGSCFLKTRDDRFVIKQLSKPEMSALKKFAPGYFEHMWKVFYENLPCVLAKIYGFYRIGFRNPQTGKSMKMDVFVMENLFYERKISRIFDLKGSMRNRHVQATGKQNEVLLDENLLEFIYESPLFIREHSKIVLQTSVFNDTLFLSKWHVMDYSLLVGIDEENHTLVVGIVDYIRTFTWDKKLESWVKETGFLGGGGNQPTIVSPRQYKSRFREAMSRYFLMVPDKFTHNHNEEGEQRKTTI